MDEELIVGTEPTENNDTEVTVTEPIKESDDEVLKLVENLTEAYEKVSSDAESYKKGMLKYQRKLKELGLDDEDEKPVAPSREELAQIIREEIRAVVPEVLKPQEDGAKKTIAELKNALRNRPQAPSSKGASSDKPTSTHKYFSPEQEAELKRRGLDPKQVFENMKKNQQGNVQ